MKIGRRIVAGLLSVVMAVSLISFIPAKTNADYRYGEITGSHDYANGSNWSQVPRSYLTKLSDGYMIVCGGSAGINGINVYYYDNNLAPTSTKSIAMNGSIWGGFCEDGAYYYVLTGNSDVNETKTVESFILTKYDKNWNQVGKCSLKDCNTRTPFEAGSVAFQFVGSTLIVHTCHTMYKSADGLNHQSNITIEFNTANMTIPQSNHYHQLSESSVSYSSHSFNQFLAMDGNMMVFVDHGDAYPRAVKLHATGAYSYDTGRTAGYYYYPNGKPYEEHTYTVTSFPGGTGVNRTGFTLGGVAVSSTSYLTVGTTIDMNHFADGYRTKNVCVYITNKANETTTTKMLTNYAEGELSAGNPYIVKVNDNCFAVIWERDNTLYYTYLDGNGNQTEQTFSRPGKVSSMKPIVSGNNIIWAVMEFDRPAEFYSIVADPALAKEQIGEFVDRLYLTCMNRSADPGGKSHWVNGLFAGSYTGIGAANGFVFSSEFKNMNLCDSCYLDRLYEAFMGRAADAAGKNYWLGELAKGKTREEVFNGFATSKEFRGICEKYGIALGDAISIPQNGTVPTGACSVCGGTSYDEDGIIGFVTRLYNVCLDRDPDAGGLEHWKNKLITKESNGKDIACGFVFSSEFTNKNYSDEDFVEYMYKAFFGRSSDAQGKAFWVGKIQNDGYTRQQVFYGFVYSNEFQGICDSYGIVRG